MYVPLFQENRTFQNDLVAVVQWLIGNLSRRQYFFWNIKIFAEGFFLIARKSDVYFFLAIWYLLSNINYIPGEME